MDAFEVIAARFFEVQGFWTRIGVKVEITKQEKVVLDNASMPRPEIDVVAWKPATNQLLIIECKRAISIRRASGSKHLHGQEDADNSRLTGVGEKTISSFEARGALLFASGVESIPRDDSTQQPHPGFAKTPTPVRGGKTSNSVTP